MKGSSGAGLAVIVWLVLTPAFGADAPPDACGLAPGDWCSPPPGDRCGIHKDEASCRADPECFGMPYRGESLERCIFDERGFASNCPAVGCTSVAPKEPSE